MKIIVTGGCGFIGSNLVRHLLDSPEHEVLNLDKLTYAGNPHSLADLADDPRPARPRHLDLPARDPR